jgi:ribonuclease BN (tRNA processing enzyme)
MTEVIFVGTSDAFGAGGRRQSAYVLRTEEGSTLVDCSGTTLTGLNVLGIERDEISTILISHYHGDHFMGIPQFLLAAIYEDKRRAPLHIAGPSGVEARIFNLCSVVGYGLEGREIPFPLIFHDLTAGEEMEIGPVCVTPFNAHHQESTQPHGLIMRLAGGHQVVYTGDTGWFDGLPEYTQGADLFICECTSYDRGLDFHINFRDIYEHREKLGARRVILTHLGPSMSSRRGSCPMETADDGLKITL